MVKGHIERLQRWTLHEAERWRASAEEIARGAARLQRIVTNLITAVQVETGELRLVVASTDLDELIRSVAREGDGGSWPRPVTLSLAPARVRGDASRLKYVVRTLFDNACRFSPEGAEITVRLVVTNDRARLSVTNRGPGIPKERWDKVFERFGRAHAGSSVDRGGMGVELYLSREIVQAHRGEIWFESSDDKTTFFVELPRREGADGEKDHPGHR